MKRAIIGYGNILRGEDAFGIDVLKELEKSNIKDTKLIIKPMLTPELALELLDIEEIVFIDACFDTQNHYALACTTLQNNSNQSHFISPKMVVMILRSVYGKYPKWELFSMLTDSFETIEDKKSYIKKLNQVRDYLFFS